MRLTIPCPCCESRSTAVKTKPMSRVFIEVTYRCSNTDCNFSFVAGVEVLRALNLGPYALPEELGIPLSPAINRRMLIQQLERARTAPALKRTSKAPVQDLAARKRTALQGQNSAAWHSAITDGAPDRAAAATAAALSRAAKRAQHQRAAAAANQAKAAKRCSSSDALA